ncbi:hypothetical protein I5Q23_22750 [Serratia marcescens]|nr:hypothetical protein [Serratia marcescens]
MSNMKLGNRHRNKERVLTEVVTPNLPEKKFIMSMPENLHTEFKLLCVSKGVAMKDVVIQAIKEWVKDNNK